MGLIVLGPKVELNFQIVVYMEEPLTKAQVLAFIQDEDIPYEEDIQRNPYAIKIWIRYIDLKCVSLERVKSLEQEHSVNAVLWFPLWSLYERALKLFPGSYKLWKSYLDHRLLQASKSDQRVDQQSCPAADQNSSQALYGLWERALLTQSKAPRMWISYLEHIMASLAQLKDSSGKNSRFFLWVFDRALRALPLSQHHRVWPIGLSMAEKPECYSLVAATIFSRYAAIDPEATDKLIFLLETRDLPEAALKAIASRRLNVKEQGKFVEGDTSAAYLHRMVELAAQTSKMRPGELEAIVLAGIADGRLAHDAGWALAALSAHLLQRPEAGAQELARDILISALDGRKGVLIRTARDFGLVFDALAKLEEMAIGRLLRQLSKKRRNPQLSLRQEADWRLARFERLMAQREWLLSGVLVRASPSDVGLWLRRISLGIAADPTRRTELFMQAIDSIKRGSHKLSELWLAFAKGATSSEEQREIFERALGNGTDYFASTEETSSVWLAYSSAFSDPPSGSNEMALEILQRATAIHPRALALWGAIIEMEIKMGRPVRVKCAFERTLELRIATPAIVFSYIDFLESGNAGILLGSHSQPDAADSTEIDPKARSDSNQDSRDAIIFSVYERAIAAFGFPAAMDLWSAYLCRFEAMLSNRQQCPWRLVERGRELYEQAVRGAPDSKTVWIAYASFEERFGQPRASLSVLRRGITAVAASATAPKDDLVDLWMVLLAKTQHYSGLLASRDVYEEAIRSSSSPLPDSAVRNLCLGYAALEASLGEVERARSIYAYGSRLADSRTCGSYWEAWETFERAHGSQDTFRELLRVKRAVQAQFSIADVQFVPAAGESSIPPPGQEHPFAQLSDHR